MIKLHCIVDTMTQFKYYKIYYFLCWVLTMLLGFHCRHHSWVMCHGWFRFGRFAGYCPFWVARLMRVIVPLNFRSDCQSWVALRGSRHQDMVNVTVGASCWSAEMDLHLLCGPWGLRCPRRGLWLGKSWQIQVIISRRHLFLPLPWSAMPLLYTVQIVKKILIMNGSINLF